MVYFKKKQSVCRREVLCTKGKQPRSPIKVSKFVLSVKRSENTKTARMFAQRQPSFKECVTAH